MFPGKLLVICTELKDSHSQQQIDVPLRKGGELRLLRPDSLLLWLLQGMSISVPTLTQIVKNH